jgi:peptidoglycan/xylan/chitin deacetylase (PgdA/CDA1 family)
MRVTTALSFLAVLAAASVATIALAEAPHAPGVTPIEVDATIEQMQAAVSDVRAGRRMQPKSWPGGARVAVCISFDIDNETLWRTNPIPAFLSEGEYGAMEALPRILGILDRYQIPATFYIPAMSAALHPQMIKDILQRKRHEIGVHGWVHEEPSSIGDRAKEEKALNDAIAYLTHEIGKRPVGYRAPSWDFSRDTLDLVQKAGFLYDSSLSAMDSPYELLAHGKPSGVVELPVNYILDDWPYYEPDATGSMPSPSAVYEVYRDEFDGAYAEGGLFILTLHPHVSGHRSRIVVLDRILSHIKSKPDVWFATLEQVASYVKSQH